MEYGTLAALASSHWAGNLGDGRMDVWGAED